MPINWILGHKPQQIYMAKTPSGDFKVTTLENPLLSKPAVVSKGIRVPYTNLQLNLYPNTQLDLFCSDNLSFSMHDSQCATSRACTVLQFIQTMKIMKLLGHKTLWCTNTTASSRTRANQIFGHTFLHTCGFVLLCNCASPFTPLKIIFIYIQGCEKRNLKHTFTDWMKIRTENQNFINLDRYPIYRAAVEPRAETALFKPR